jgi:uncharacterized membrane protein
MWFLLALLAAVMQVFRNMAMKQLGHALDETINVWGRFVFLLPFAAMGVAIRGVPPLGQGFWGVAVLFGITQVLATLCLAKALKSSQISLVTPLWKLSVILLVVWGFFALGERPSALGVAGVLLSMAGVYLLNVEQARIAWWAPLAAIARDPGQRWTLGAAMGYAPAVVLIKQLALLSDAWFAMLIGYIVCSAIMTPYAIYRSARHFRDVPRHWLAFVSLGGLAAGNSVVSTIAYTMTVSAYVEAVKQVEVLFALGVGYVVFREGATIRAVWLGALVMMLGIVLLNLGG